MDFGSQNDSDGGGERHGGLQPTTGLANTERDEGSAQQRSLQTVDRPSDPGLNCKLRPRTPPVLSLDQIRISGGSNEYTDGPTASTGSGTDGQQETDEERSNNLRNLHLVTQHGNTNTLIPSGEVESRPSSTEGSQSSVKTSAGNGSSGQRLLGSPAIGNEIIRNQPKRADSEELKPLNNQHRDSRTALKNDKHSKKCESCGRCRCSECVRPRPLPSCWLCGQRCVCSPYTAVEYGTCVCCIKGLFYHCSNDDEDTSADKPFSCSQSNCCARWTAISVLSLVFPCLLCYLPAKGCLATCQCCYDRVTRPGCRCKNSTPTRHHGDSAAT